ncbi:MAG TPA: hypothetical protein VGN60_00170 [Devosia sp.]|jgi:hypothetical protein|nr:hypothetical protein [Devosia sp.]
MAESDAQTKELDYIRTEIRNETSLLNNRLNSLMSSQSFLIIAYGGALSSGYGDFRSVFTLTVPPFLALLGGALVLEARPSLRAALLAIDHWRKREANLVDSSEDYAPYTLAVDDQARQMMQHRQHQGRHFAARAPIIMLSAWTVLLLAPLGLYFWGSP